MHNLSHHSHTLYKCDYHEYTEYQSKEEKGEFDAYQGSDIAKLLEFGNEK